MPLLTNAQLIGRLSFGPTAAQLERFADESPAAVVAALLDAPPAESTAPSADRFDFENEGWALVDWWIEVMRRDDTGVHERLVWFWHGLLTSSAEKTSWEAMLVQHERLRRLARGNFRDLLREMTTDIAMLDWLDGNGSRAEAPNENHARELMELFALGRHSGAYTEADVRSAAYLMSGWWADAWEMESGYDEDLGPRRAVTFLGRSARTIDDVIDIVCDHPACAPYIARRMYTHFTGALPGPGVLEEISAAFADSGLDVDVLVRAICTHPSFVNGPPRARTPVEWFLAAERLLGATIDQWTLELLGQSPMHPPNVAGWPDGQRWLAAGALLTKANTAIDNAWDAPTLSDADPVADVLARAGLTSVSASTREALDQAANSSEERRQRSSLLFALTALSPEFNVT